MTSPFSDLNVLPKHKSTAQASEWFQALRIASKLPAFSVMLLPALPEVLMVETEILKCDFGRSLFGNPSHSEVWAYRKDDISLIPALLPSFI